jgi:signal transduction histidine kinase
VGSVTTGFAAAIADRIAAEHALLAARWFARLRELLPVGADEVFPSDSLLDHIPTLILDVSEYVRAPQEQAIAANTQVVEKARELGALRHQQRASLHQVLREHQLLGSILLTFVQDEWIRLELSPPPEESMTVVVRIHQAVAVLLQETVETFVGLYTRTITEQSERLQQFTRMATHEWRQPLMPIMTAVSLLRVPELAAAQRAQVIEMMDRNVRSLVNMTHTLERVARLDGSQDNASLQAVSVSVVASEAARQLRDMAEARGVVIQIADDMPAITIDVGRLELAIVNLLSNGIKYCDMEKSERLVTVNGRQLDGGAVEIVVRDNGIGIPATRLAHIFERFTRAHADRAGLESIVGVGLGLAIVDDCITAVRGSVRVESKEGAGTAFVITLPPAPRP